MCAIMDSVPTRADPQTTHCSSMWKERMCWFSELCCEKVPEQNSHLKVTSTLVVRPFLPPPPPAFLAAEAAREAWWAWETDDGNLIFEHLLFEAESWEIK